MTVPKPPDPLLSYLDSYASPDWRARAGPLGMLRLSDPLKTALRAYENTLVASARRDGASWTDIGDALGIARQNAYRRFHHVDPDPV